MGALVAILERSSSSFAAAIQRNDITLAKGTAIGGRRRKKRIDLVMERRGGDRKIVAVEAKACMTAHTKAHTRLVAELTASIDAVKEYDSNAAFFAIVAVNFSELFTSPLNLPGPNRHGPLDGTKLVRAVEEGLSTAGDDIAGMLYMPIEFDNETYCRPTLDGTKTYRDLETTFLARVCSALGV